MDGAVAPKDFRHAEEFVELQTTTESAFAYLDDHERLGAHMSRSSWMMGGSRMAYELDDAKGRRVGASMRLSGRFLGVPLEVRSVVKERVVPLRKSWETRGEPRLLVIGAYRMGFELAPGDPASSLRVFIDYARPARGIQRLLGTLFGALYARWCVRSMARDAERHFRRTSA